MVLVSRFGIPTRSKRPSVYVIRVTVTVLSKIFDVEICDTKRALNVNPKGTLG
jgi:hypothetical protein